MSFGPADQEIALETIERMGASLTRWEESFIKSIRDQLNAGRPLTGRQVETLERIYVKRTGQMPVRLQRRRAKGWRMPPGAVYVGRPTKWGNPFVVGRDGTVAECLRLYRLLADGFICLTTKATPADQDRAREAMASALNELRGKDLLCWCPPGRPCHADVLLEIANG